MLKLAIGFCEFGISWKLGKFILKCVHNEKCVAVDRIFFFLTFSLLLSFLLTLGHNFTNGYLEFVCCFVSIGVGYARGGVAPPFPKPMYSRLRRGIQSRVLALTTKDCTSWVSQLTPSQFVWPWVFSVYGDNYRESIVFFIYFFLGEGYVYILLFDNNPLSTPFNSFFPPIQIYAVDNKTVLYLKKKIVWHILMFKLHLIPADAQRSKLRWLHLQELWRRKRAMSGYVTVNFLFLIECYIVKNLLVVYCWL